MKLAKQGHAKGVCPWQVNCMDGSTINQGKTMSAKQDRRSLPIAWTEGSQVHEPVQVPIVPEPEQPTRFMTFATLENDDLLCLFNDGGFKFMPSPERIW